MAGQYNSTQPTLNDRAKVPLQVDANGNLRTVSAATGSSSDQVQGTTAHDAVDPADNPVAIGGRANSGIPTAVAIGDRVKGWFGLNGQQVVTLADNTGGQVGTALDNASVAGQRALIGVVVPKGTTAGGLSPARVVTGTTGVIKASAGQLYSLTSVRNGNAAVRYLHIYDKATAPTLSTDTPVLTISLAASSVQNDINFTNIGVAFANGIAWSYTTDNVAIPTTAGTSTELMFSAAYK